MILHGNQRGGAKDLAQHLMKDENDHVELHELRGFASDNLDDAFQESYAISRGTQCKQFLFSLSLNPPPQEQVSPEQFEAAITKVEDRLDLTGQPRAIVFHEKEGRRHAHAVWSRIKTDEMKAVQLSFSHQDLRQVSRELYIEHGWDMPRSLLDSEARHPKNFTLAEWQQAKRVGKDAAAVKTAFQDAWATSDSKVAFAHALEEQGYVLARGDKRGYVAIDHLNEVYSVPRMVGIRTKQVRERLGKTEELPDVETAKQQIAADMIPAMHRFRKALNTEQQQERDQYLQEKDKLIEKQRLERQTFKNKIEARRNEEARTRQTRFRTGFKGLWDRINGQHKRITEQNAVEVAQATQRDRAEKEKVVSDQLTQRRALKERIQSMQEHMKKRRHEIDRDRQRFELARGSPQGPER
jgi:hypothetical protein